MRNYRVEVSHGEPRSFKKVRNGRNLVPEESSSIRSTRAADAGTLPRRGVMIRKNKGINEIVVMSSNVDIGILSLA